MHDNWLEGFNPDRERLLGLLLREIDDQMLREIAHADYGRDVELHFAPLHKFRSTRDPIDLDWHPCEVLELIRWSQPEDPEWLPGAPGRRGHFMRAFSCVALLVSYDLEVNRHRWMSFNETSIQLADSLRVLGQDYVAAGTHFFAWCIRHLAKVDEDGTEIPYLGLALLALAINVPTIADQHVVRLCKWIDGSVTALLPENQWKATRRKHWLMSMNFHNLRNERWVEIGHQLERWGAAQPCSEKATWAALIGAALAET